MTELPSMPLFVDSYEAATNHLTLEEDGAYSRLLRLCWRTAGCSVPNDPQWLAKRMRITEEAFERVLRPVIEEFFTLENGRLFQKRLRQEYDYVTDVVAKRKEAGRRGGNAKALKNHTDDAGKRTILPEQTASKTLAPTLTPTHKEDLRTKPKNRASYPEEFEAFWKAYPTDPIMSKAEAAKEFGRLTDEERRQAIEAVPAFVAHCTANPTYRPVHANRFLSQRRFEQLLASPASSGTADPNLVSLPPDHPDFKAVERLRGKHIHVFGNKGEATFTKAEVEQARKLAASAKDGALF